MIAISRRLRITALAALTLLSLAQSPAVGATASEVSYRGWISPPPEFYGYYRHDYYARSETAIFAGDMNGSGSCWIYGVDHSYYYANDYWTTSGFGYAEGECYLAAAASSKQGAQEIVIQLRYTNVTRVGNKLFFNGVGTFPNGEQVNFTGAGVILEDPPDGIIIRLSYLFE